jgi:hypothetical protein
MNHTERVEIQNGHPIVQTSRHHRYNLDVRDIATNDFICVRCGITGHFSYILDYKPCSPFYVALDHLDDAADIICRDLDGES